MFIVYCSDAGSQLKPFWTVIPYTPQSVKDATVGIIPCPMEFVIGEFSAQNNCVLCAMCQIKADGGTTCSPPYKETITLAIQFLPTLYLLFSDTKSLTNRAAWCKATLPQTETPSQNQ